MSALSTKISAFAISYNREELIETCLRSLRFADELIVVDKSSSDGTVQIAERYADRVIVVPWSPTVEETRAFALSQCTHDNIVFLDDDEVLSVAAIEYVRKHSAAGTLRVAAFPQRQYILGRHDENAHYWPEHQIRAFFKGCVEFGDKVHAGVKLRTDEIDRVSIDSDICTHNLSYKSTEEWIEKTNRYTSVQNRHFLAEDTAKPLPEFVRERLEYWLGKRHIPSPYVDSVAVLRAIYDIVDRIKIEEISLGVAPASDFKSLCRTLNEELDAFGATAGLNLSPRSVDVASAAPSRAPALVAHYDRTGLPPKPAELAPALADRDAKIAGLTEQISDLRIERERLLAQAVSLDVLLARKDQTELETQGAMKALQHEFNEFRRQNLESRFAKPTR